MSYQEMLVDQSIPSVSVNAARTLQSVRSQLLQLTQPLLAHRESLFQRGQPLSHSLARKLLRTSYKAHSAFGCWDPVTVRHTLNHSGVYRDYKIHKHSSLSLLLLEHRVVRYRLSCFLFSLPTNI